MRTLFLAFLAVAPVQAALAPGAAAPELNGGLLDLLKGALRPGREKAAKESASRPLFTVAPHEGKTLLTIRAGQLDRAYLLSETLSKGLGEKGLHAGTPANGFLFAFRRAG